MVKNEADFLDGFLIGSGIPRPGKKEFEMFYGGSAKTLEILSQMRISDKELFRNMYTNKWIDK